MELHLGEMSLCHLKLDKLPAHRALNKIALPLHLKYLRRPKRLRISNFFVLLFAESLSGVWAVDCPAAGWSGTSIWKALGPNYTDSGRRGCAWGFLDQIEGVNIGRSSCKPCKHT